MTGRRSSIYCSSRKLSEFYFAKGRQHQGREEFRGIHASSAWGNLDRGSCLSTGNTWSLNKQTIEYLVCGDGMILVIEPWINKDIYVCQSFCSFSFVLATKRWNWSKTFCCPDWWFMMTYSVSIYCCFTYKEVCEPVGPSKARIRRSWHSWPQCWDRAERSLMLYTPKVINNPDLEQENCFKTFRLSTFFWMQGKCKGQKLFTLLKQLELFERFVPYDLARLSLYAPGTRNYQRWKASIYFSPRTKMFSTSARM